MDDVSSTPSIANLAYDTNSASEIALLATLATTSKPTFGLSGDPIAGAVALLAIRWIVVGEGRLLGGLHCDLVVVGVCGMASGRD